MTTEVLENDGKITCQIDGALCHSIQLHLRDHHAEWTVERYKAEFPDAPLLSKLAEKKLQQRRDQEKARTEAAPETTGRKAMVMKKQAFHEVFDLGSSKAAMNARGEPIMITVMDDLDEEAESYIPSVDENYVFNIDLTKTGLMAMELGMPFYFWGYHGTGKTTAMEQIAARTKRPFLRVQHTINTEESHIVGQYVVRNGNTEFQLGPLPTAMIHGYFYCADEYDFAMPSVLSVYQPVLEGKALIIKDAPPEFRVIRPHANFRFGATGNTNGGGDETGLYQGTQIQNAANYSRFSIVEEVGYMEPKIEAAVVSGQSGIDRKDAEKLVSFAKEVREAFKAGRIGATISPRELINSAKLGLVRGSDWRGGLKLGFTNRLSRTDKEVVEQYAQRVFA